MFADYLSNIIVEIIVSTIFIIFGITWRLISKRFKTKDEKGKEEGSSSAPYKKPEKKSVEDFVTKICAHLHTDIIEVVVSVKTQIVSERHWTVKIIAEYIDGSHVASVAEKVSKSLEDEFSQTKFQVTVEKDRLELDEMKYLKITHPGEPFSLKWDAQDVYVFETPTGKVSQYYYKTVNENAHVIKLYAKICKGLMPQYCTGIINVTALYAAFILSAPKTAASTLTIELVNKTLHLKYEKKDQKVEKELVDRLVSLLKNPKSTSLYIQGNTLNVKIEKSARQLSDDVREELEPYIATGYDKILKQMEEQSKPINQIIAVLYTSIEHLSKVSVPFDKTDEETIGGLKFSMEILGQLTVFMNISEDVPSELASNSIFIGAVVTATGLLGFTLAAISGELQDTIDVDKHLKKVQQLITGAFALAKNEEFSLENFREKLKEGLVMFARLSCEKCKKHECIHDH